VNRLNRERSLDEWRGTWSWTDSGGNKTGSVSVSVENGVVRFKGTMNGEPLDQSVHIVRTPCNYGGDRPWFKCPYCYRRCGKLYLGIDAFACRKCYRLQHASTREDHVTRLWRKRERLKARLEPDKSKPKGMHWRTFDTIFDKMDDIDAALDQAFIVGARRILSWAA